MEEISIKKDDSISVITKNSISDIIKPLQSEIHLFDSFIAGTTHIEEINAIDKIKVGDGLSLIRENNKFDENAIMIISDEKKKLGYVPEKDNVIFSRLLDAGKLLKAKVKDIEKHGSLCKIAIGIYLIDF